MGGDDVVGTTEGIIEGEKVGKSVGEKVGLNVKGGLVRIVKIPATNPA